MIALMLSWLRLVWVLEVAVGLYGRVLGSGKESRAASTGTGGGSY
jgi:hypothetical protein